MPNPNVGLFCAFIADNASAVSRFDTVGCDDCYRCTFGTENDCQGECVYDSAYCSGDYEECEEGYEWDPGVLKCMPIDEEGEEEDVDRGFTICGTPVEAAEGPDGFYDYIVDKNGMHYSCWSGDPLTSSRKPIFDYDHNYGIVCMIGSAIVQEAEYNPSYSSFSALGHCLIDTTQCKETEYWDPDSESCYDCPSNAIGDRDWSADSKDIYIGHKGTSCMCNRDTFMNASGECEQCPAPGGTYEPGNTSKTQCMLLSGWPYSDATGSYTMTSDCPWQP